MESSSCQNGVSMGYAENKHIFLSELTKPDHNLSNSLTKYHVLAECDAFLLKSFALKISSYNNCVSGAFGYNQMFLSIFAIGVNKLH